MSVRARSHCIEVRAVGPFASATSEREPSPRRACRDVQPPRVAQRSSPAPLRTQADAGRRTRALKPGVPSPRPGYKGRASAILAQAAEPAVPVGAVPPWSCLLRPASPHANISRSRPSPYWNLPCRPFSSQAGSSPEQSSPRPWSLHVKDRLGDQRGGGGE
jgi:hypothetical protein